MAIRILLPYVARINVQLRVVARTPIALATRNCLHCVGRSLSSDKDLATRVPLPWPRYLGKDKLSPGGFSF